MAQGVRPSRPRAPVLAVLIAMVMAVAILVLLRPPTRSATRPTLTREMADAINFYAAPFCSLDAHAGDEVLQVQRRLTACTRRGH